ncbi:MAG: amidohydrolase family protein [Candidatus Bathyarchaeia archaeon]
MPLNKNLLLDRQESFNIVNRVIVWLEILKFSNTAKYLFEVFHDMKLIDAHEHLPPEKIRTGRKVDALTLFSNYVRWDLASAGMPQESINSLQDTDIPVKQRWKRFAPYLERVRHGSFARASFIAAKEFYGYDDINETNCVALSEKMMTENTPGIYDRILRKKCKIEAALTQSSYWGRWWSDNRLDFDDGILVPLAEPHLGGFGEIRTKKDVNELAEKLGETVKTLDDYLALTKRGLEKWKLAGAVGLKMSSLPYDASDRTQAESLFDKLMHNPNEHLPEMNPLRSYLMEFILDQAAELEVVVAIHAGIWVPPTYSSHDPRHMIPIIIRHPQTRFDLYHLGFPYVNETIMIAKNFPNVWLNLCWCHILSPSMTCSAMSKLIDAIPVNKVIAFGGDYGIGPMGPVGGKKMGPPVEKVYGHLLIARENIAKVFAARIDSGILTLDQAISIAEKWFYQNPKDLYNLKV